MKKLSFLLLVGLTFLCLPVFAANKSRSIKTDYFTVTIPAGWNMPAPLKQQPLGGVSVAFVKTGSDVAVTLNFLELGVSAKDFAEKMIQDMNKSDMKASKPVEQKGLYTFSIHGKADGKAWIGARDGVCAATLVFGTDFSQAAPLLRAIRLLPKYEKLVPVSAE